MAVAELGTWAGWTAFLVVVGAMLAVDLGVRQRTPHRPSVRRAAWWSAAWFAVAIAFTAGVALTRGSEAGWSFASAYLIEKALSLDNILVFAVLFQAFAVPDTARHRVLFWGVIGALVMRAAMLIGGAALLDAAHWMIYVFGAVLLLTGIKLLRGGGAHGDATRHPLYRLFQRWVPTTETYHGARFWVTENGIRKATPLLAVLVLVELTDQLFALDSLPAVLGVSHDPFIVVTSNALAVLGMRSLYFCLEGVTHRLRYLNAGLATVLVFVGAKMLLEDVYKVPPALSLAVIALILTTAAACSLVATRRERERAETAPNAPLPAMGRS